MVTSFGHQWYQASTIGLRKRKDSSWHGSKWPPDAKVLVHWCPNEVTILELDLVGHEVSRRHTRFPVPVLDNTTYAPPATTNIALDTSPHGESQGLLDALGLPARILGRASK